MERKYGGSEEAWGVAKEAMWLAWNAAGGPSGSGFLQDKPTADKQAVWNNAYNMGDYCGRQGMADNYINADYVFGRMLKLRFTIKNNTIEYPDRTPTPDYQGWCRKYKTYAELFEAAENSVQEKV